jgi:hypothetical protein
MNSLEELAIKYGTDKQESCHGYIKHYFNHLQHLQNIPITMVEFGVHKGASLMMWADFFTQGTVYGVDDGSSGDLKDSYPDHSNIRFRYGIQTDEKLLTSLIQESPKFDIIVDDGSHYSQDIIYTFKKMFDSIKPGGWYIIEDLETSYPPYIVGSLAPRFNRDNFTATEFISRLVDYMHTTQSQIESITTYKGITFIKRK